MIAPSSVVWQGSDVDLTTVEKELSYLWAKLVEEQSLTGAARASIFNLVIYTADAAEAERVSESLSHLSKRVPSRSIILVGDRYNTRCSLDASAEVHCRRSPGGSLPLCYERVVITAHGRSADHLASVVFPLIDAELPTYLWWPGQPPFGHRMFHRLLSAADQLVVDSAAFSSPGDGLANLARVCSGKQGVNDFQWARLTPWREIIAQFFDGPTWLPYLAGIRSIRAEFGKAPDTRLATAGLLLLLGWLNAELGWEPETTLDDVLRGDVGLSVLQGDRLIPIDVQLRDHGAVGAGRLVALDVVSQPKGMPPARFQVRRSGDLSNAETSMTIHDGPQLSRTVPTASPSDVDLLADELTLVGHDKLYDLVALEASRMAGREVWVAA